VGQFIQSLLKMVNVPKPALEQSGPTEAEEDNYLLAVDLFEGNNCQKNTRKAIEMLETMAKNDNIKAIRYLQEIYSKSPNHLDRKKEIYWLQRGEALGDFDDTVKLAQLYYYGDGVERNFPKAFELWSKIPPEHRDWKLATANLGVCYSEGLGVPQDKEKAIDLWLKICDSFCRANYWLGKICYDRGQYREGFEYFRRCYVVACKEDVQIIPDVAFMLGTCYHKGFGTNRDIHEAKVYYEIASAYGSQEADVHLAYLNWDKREVPKFCYKEKTEANITN